MQRNDPETELAMIKRELAKNPPTDETVKKYAAQRIEELVITIRNKKLSAITSIPKIEAASAKPIQHQKKDSCVKFAKYKVSLSDPKVQASIYFCVVGSITWLMSPIEPIPTIELLAFSVWLSYGVFEPRGPRLRRVLIAILLTAIEVFSVATLHDINVTSYASARCRDSIYSYSATHQGTCSWHGGVIQWNPEIPPWWRRFRD
jgi:hypothetical protein